jgi:hypothetical protein
VQRRLLRANEASRRIGTSLDTARTAEKLAEFGTEDFADLVTVDLLDSLLHDGDAHPPAPAAHTPVLRRIAQRSALGDDVELPVATGRTHTYPAESEPARGLASGQPRLHRATAPASDHRSALLLPLRARGNILGLAHFLRRATAPPFDDDDLLLTQEIAALAAVSIDNARRYSQERTTALTLQRSLLPQRAVEQSAVDTASRYLPSAARTGVGGDWYDVIPLSGARRPRRRRHRRPRSARRRHHGPPAHGRAVLRGHRPHARRTPHAPGRRGGPPPARGGAGRRRVERHLPVRGLRSGVPRVHAGQRRPCRAGRGNSSSRPRR